LLSSAEEAEEVAAIVKMIQNALIGFVTVGITLFWLCADAVVFLTSRF